MNHFCAGAAVKATFFVPKVDVSLIYAFESFDNCFHHFYVFEKSWAKKAQIGLIYFFFFSLKIQ
jgi:hypothetical protein